MRFLRDRRGNAEHAWTSDSHTAKEKAAALNVLSGAVVLVRHPYERHPNSGAGNCWCGRHEASSIHQIVIEP